MVRGSEVKGPFLRKALIIAETGGRGAVLAGRNRPFYPLISRIEPAGRFLPRPAEEGKDEWRRENRRKGQKFRFQTHFMLPSNETFSEVGVKWCCGRVVGRRVVSDFARPPGWVSLSGVHWHRPRGSDGRLKTEVGGRRSEARESDKRKLGKLDRREGWRTSNIKRKPKAVTVGYA